MIRVVLDRSPFYAEGGGQVGDSGEIVSADTRFEVLRHQTRRRTNRALWAIEKRRIKGRPKGYGAGQLAASQRHRTAHSATHILHHALQSSIGSHAQQQGSKVDADWLRFDFTNQAALTDDQVDTIEKIVSQRVREAAPVSWKLVPLGEARKAGAIDVVRRKVFPIQSAWLAWVSFRASCAAART